jgi:type III restriction enzyme
LRQPQKESLEILDRIANEIELGKNVDLVNALGKVREAYPSVVDFERDFPSLCFALATGVGKTRLMGAFISYLYLQGLSRHFFVLAPNLTIYNKLIADFEPSNHKYVFKGIGELSANPPIVVTGDNYESGQGVRFDQVIPKGSSGRLYETGESVFIQKKLFEPEESVIINIFNISKIDSEARRGASPKIKRLQEYIGESYFDYLANLPDLVLLMDEAHRYRATAGTKAISELKPILGLELTATPKTVGANSQPFSNVIYSYSLGSAMADGFVKEPAVATRTNFQKELYTDKPQELELIKLEDAVHYHEHVKVELNTFAKNNDKAMVHPFMLVVAQNTAHATELRTLIESNRFFDGRYKGRVIEVHSNLRGEESDEATTRLLSVEHDPETEIVIHVNKLKEGWDVTNLYTIVPLRASASEIMTEQTIGRGLRLPYGQRTGIDVLDRLTIIAHDRFQDVLDAAHLPDSIIKKTIQIGEGGDIAPTQPKALEVPSIVENLLTKIGDGKRFDGKESVIKTDDDRKIAAVVLDVVKQFEELGSSSRLQETDIRAQIEAKVKEILPPVQLNVPGILSERNLVPDIVAEVTKTLAECYIDIPNILVIPKNKVTYFFENFDMTDLENVRLQPVDQEILIQHLRTDERSYLYSSSSIARESRVENYLVRRLMDFKQIDYDSHSELLYKLAGQVIHQLRSYLKSEEEVEKVLLYHQKTLADLIFSQMMGHYKESDPEFEVRVNKGFSVPRRNNFSQDDPLKDFRVPVADKSAIRRMCFSGFHKCCYDVQKFDSDTERRFAMLLEDDRTVLRWMKPGPGHFQIEWKSGHPYQPDFVVETATEKFICETKANSDLQLPEVLLKAKAAVKWCKHASEHALETNTKPWTYLLIPQSDVSSNRTLDGLKAAGGLPLV